MPTDPVFCENCGQISELLTGLLEAKEEALVGLERELRGKRAQISRLQKEREGQDTMNPNWERALEVFDYWKAKIGSKAREFSGTKRAAAVLARLEAGDPEDRLALIKRAIDGVARLPYVTHEGRSATGLAKQRQVELELICRSEANLERFAGYTDPEEPPAPVSRPPSPPSNGWHPRNRRELVEALRGRVLLFELEENPNRARRLLDEIHAFTA